MKEALTTPRLTLRRWRDPDRVLFQAINADPRVMEFILGLLTPQQSDDLIARIEKHFDQHGFGLYAAELVATKALIGFVGLNIPSFDAPFMHAPVSAPTEPSRDHVVEIGWRIAADHWGSGLATEGARAVVDHAFNTLGSPSLVSFTVPGNLRSRRVMEKLGMTHNPADDFDHPSLPSGHPLRRHVLYRLDHARGCSVSRL